jgi:hypothetical protein
VASCHQKEKKINKKMGYHVILRKITWLCQLEPNLKIRRTPCVTKIRRFLQTSGIQEAKKHKILRGLFGPIMR